jgi:hypothetical protein
MYILECEKYREMEEIKKRSKLYYIRYIRDFETGHVSWHQLLPIIFLNIHGIISPFIQSHNHSLV